MSGVEAETTRRRQGLLVRGEKLQQLELLQCRERQRVVDRPRWRRSPAASERRHALLALFEGELFY